MQGQSISKIIVACVLMMAAVYVVLDVMSSGGNALGRIYAYLLFASAVYGLLSPKGAFVYLLVLTGYLDMLKRFMIFDSGVSMGDLYNVLGIAPATMAGILSNVCYSLIQGRRRVVPGQVRNSLVVIVLMALLLALSLIAMGRAGRALGDAVNMVCYLALLVTVPFLYETPRELQRLYRQLILVYVPAAFYMIYQSAVGLSGWEMDYVRSGLTVEIRQLNEVRFRPFGTMNSAAAGASVFSLLAVLALMGPWRRRDEDGIPARGFSRSMSLFYFLLFCTAAAVTITRTGWLQGIAAMGAVLMFSSRFRTRLFYFVSIAASGLLIGSSSWLVSSGWFEDMESAIRKVFTGDVSLRSATIGTFGDRLVSYQRLVGNGEIWTPFGWSVAGKQQLSQIFAHDAISELLIKFGYIPLGGLLILGVWTLWRLHAITLAPGDPLSRRMALISAACFFGALTGGLSTSAILTMFPMNFLLWLFPSVILAVDYHRRAVARLEVQQKAPERKRSSPETVSGFPLRGLAAKSAR